MSFAADPSLLQDFLAESGELIEQLDRDLVVLEQEAAGPGALDLLNGIFRALHTIKGAASFLALNEVTTFAHAAEDALNRLRKGDTPVTSPCMDALLKSVDVVRGMLAEVSQGTPVTAGPDDLIARLHEIAHGTAPAPAAAPPVAADEPADDPTVPDAAAPESRGTPLQLPQEKLDLIEFMVDDMTAAVREIGTCLDRAAQPEQRVTAALRIADLADDLHKTAEFFGLGGLDQVAAMIDQAAKALQHADAVSAAALSTHVRDLCGLIDEQAAALRQHQALTWSLDSRQQQIDQLTAGGKSGEPAAQSNPMPATPAAAPAASAAAAPNAPVAEATIRVEVPRLEALLNLVGQLVLSKNRILGLSRRLRASGAEAESFDDLVAAASELDRLTGELQVGVMRTRMQPLARLFERYPRVIRDTSRATGKQIDLVLRGKETEVDKSVLELLADPLIHMLRNSADHGIEMPDVRTAAGKPAKGTVTLSAEHQGSHVRVVLSDDGKGLSRDVLGRKAVERGLVSAEALAGLSDQQVFAFIFAPGFSTAEKVTDLSGRGVGMDVVRTNINKLGGTINLNSVPGQGTSVEILIPLTVAILPALIVGVGDSLYTLPLGSIDEIVRPESSSLKTVAGMPVMRLRDRVLPLVDLRARLGEPVRAIAPLAVVIGAGDQRVGLLVDRLIGRQEVVTKPLDDVHAAGGPFSGATIQEDGTVSLILDVLQLIRQGHEAASRGAMPAAA